MYACAVILLFVSQSSLSYPLISSRISSDYGSRSEHMQPRSGKTLNSS